MEPYIPLVKAIIISTMFSWGTTSEVVITHQYIFKEINETGQDNGIDIKSYKIYDLKANMVHMISGKMKSQTIVSFDTLITRYKLSRLVPDSAYEAKSDRTALSTSINPIDKSLKREIGTSLVKVNYGGFRCKMEIVKIESSAFQQEVGETINCYFAKIPWLDTYLDTENKRWFAGFNRQEYTPYHYLINEFLQYPNQVPKDLILRTIEESEVDTTLIHTLLSLPVKKN